MQKSHSVHLANIIIPDEKLQKVSAGKFAVNEIFYSLQGEGANAGTPMVFLRFAECNLRCSIKNSGFNCDTEFSSSRELSLDEVLSEIAKLSPAAKWVILTGGEPGLQVSESLVSALHESGYKIAIETNGTVKLPKNIDWITVSPKSAEHTLRQRTANEVKYVRTKGMALPLTSIEADHYFISPAFQADGSLAKEDLDWCVDLSKESAGKWKLSVQMHKLLGLR